MLVIRGVQNYVTQEFTVKQPGGQILFCQTNTFLGVNCEFRQTEKVD